MIGLDEIALKKGHRDFVTIITGPIETETGIVGVLPDRKNATVKAFLSGQQSFSRVQVYTFGADGQRNVNHKVGRLAMGCTIDVQCLVHEIYALTRKPTTLRKVSPRVECFFTIKGLCI